MRRKPPAPRTPAETKTASSYADYLRVAGILDLQHPLTAAHDELQFIVVHQVFELWFKLSIFELESARIAMERRLLGPAVHSLKRVREVIRTLTATFDVIETMRPNDFLQFRSNLQPASGLQSLQFREIEFLSGCPDRRYLGLFRGEARRRLERRLREPTLWDVYLELLEANRMAAGSRAETLRSVTGILKAPDYHVLGPLTEALYDYDHQFAVWRTRHIHMTMRLIGAKPGTGTASVGKLAASGYQTMGQGGVDYLRSTSPKVFFPLLWEARTFMEK